MAEQNSRKRIIVPVICTLLGLVAGFFIGSFVVVRNFENIVWTGQRDAQIHENASRVFTLALLRTGEIEQAIELEEQHLDSGSSSVLLPALEFNGYSDAAKHSLGKVIAYRQKFPSEDFPSERALEIAGDYIYEPKEGSKSPIAHILQD